MGATIVIFLVMRVMPGDVALVVAGATEEGARVDPVQVERIRASLGLNDPLPLQYVKWASGVLRLDPGKSLAIAKGRPLMDLVRQRFPVTVQLGFYAIAISVIWAIPLGVVAALWQDKPLDHILRSISILGLAIPHFWLATLFILFASILIGWTPPLFYANLWQDPGSHLLKMLPPALIMSWGFAGYLIRMTRSTMLEVLRQDYMRTAAAKGLSEGIRIRRHALRNALVPVVTLAGILVVNVLAGAVIMETIFGLPGMGSLVIDAVRARDYPIVQFVVTLFAFITMTVNLFVDLLYGWLDPRVSHA